MKFVFVCGGVLSGLGKGIVSSSIGLLLKSSGFDATALKIDPYFSMDAGTMRPQEHGETFVTKDGGEIDQDLGNYERFMDIDLTKEHNITSGKLYQGVINNERAFKYGGRDAEMFPDVINEIKSLILKVAKKHQITVVEIGGTTGDLENQPFLHAARELGREYKSVYVMVTYLPYLRNVGELKTKPTQHAVASLREMGIFPDFIVTRNEIPIDKPRVETISARCFVPQENIIDDPDTDCIYDTPLLLADGKFGPKLIKKLGLKSSGKDLKEWRQFVFNFKNPQKRVKIAMVGKYVKSGSTEHKDVYISVIEALRHAGAALKLGVEIVPLDSEDFEKSGKLPEGVGGLIVPQGWGSRGVEGKIKAIKLARENKIPYLGLCYGMQMAVIEFARNVAKLKKANSEEADPKGPYSVIHIMPDQKKYLELHQYGGTIRLGQWPTKFDKKSQIYKIYSRYKNYDKNYFDGEIAMERHRHRYEVNNEFREVLEVKGMKIVGLSPDGKLVEAIEIADHPFFVGTQYHPELQSRPLSPHPLFLGFLEEAIKYGSK